MIIQMVKFNTTLNGRPSAREAFLRIQQIVNGSSEREDIVLDFSAVEVLTPSYADELLRSLRERYTPEKIQIVNPSHAVSETLQAIEDASIV